jgi:phage gp45-like
MKILNRILRMIRVLVDRGVQTHDSYKNGLHILQSKMASEASPIEHEHIEPFGFASRTPNASEHIVVSLGGSRSQSLVIMAHNRQYKFELNAGEVAVYNQFGDYVHLTDGGEAHIKASTRVHAETPLFECSADCLVQGNLQVKGTTILEQSTSILAGNFVCAANGAFSLPVTMTAPATFAAAANFTGAAAFTGGITSDGTSIGLDHEHSGGTEGDGTTGGVIP